MRLTIFLLALVTALTARADSMDDKFAVLPAGESLLGARGLEEFSLQGHRALSKHPSLSYHSSLA